MDEKTPSGKKGAVVAGVGIVAAALATVFATTGHKKAEVKAPTGPNATVCGYALVVEDEAKAEHDVEGSGSFCPDHVVYGGKTYWFAQIDLKRLKMIYRAHSAIHP